MSLLQQANRYLANQVFHKNRNAFLSFPGASAVRKAVGEADSRKTSGSTKSCIDGQLIAIKDNICTVHEPTTCGSRILEGYMSPYNATLVDKLEAAGAVVCGKTNLDEFGMGSHSTHTAYASLDGWKNAQGEVVTPGGSSGGSGVAVATDQCWAALGTDTGGSIRLPATYGGIVGFKPSYGDISRHGVIDYANSLDTVGVLAKKVHITKKVYEAIRGYDPKDPTSILTSTRMRISERNALRERRSNLRFGIPIEYNIKELGPEVRQKWTDVVVMLQDLGHEIHAVSLPSMKLALSAYYLLAAAEASSNLARYDGARFGKPSSTERKVDSTLYSQTRGELLGAEVKRRILLGSFSQSATAMDNYYLQALRIRRLLWDDFNRVFALSNPLVNSHVASETIGPIDVLISPTAPTLPPLLKTLRQSSAVEIYSDDVLTVPASLAGLPSASIPFVCGDTLADTIGIQVVAQYGDEETVFRAAQMLEDLTAGD